MRAMLLREVVEAAVTEVVTAAKASLRETERQKATRLATRNFPERIASLYHNSDTIERC